MPNLAAFLQLPMALLLCIDTATETAFAGLCNSTDVLAFQTGEDQRNHAAFLQPAIQHIMLSCSVSYDDIDAVVVVNGPGSYTGLRVGLASAKGICYASCKPLILLNTLEVMASAAIAKYNDANALYCPVIDARRNEVFAALYDFSAQPIMQPQPIIVEANSFADIQPEKKIYFFGSGHKKCGNILTRENTVFTDTIYAVSDVNKLAQQYYSLKQFADMAYAEPFYTKEFYLPVR